MTAARPFYAQFGWAYDLLVNDSVEPWVEAVEAALLARLRSRSADILDAGCGTGRHAAEFAKRGHIVTLVDGSEPLLDEARKRLPTARIVCADLETLALGSTFEAIACRGVLNDICSDGARTAVLRRFASHLPAGGVIVLDVRELEGTRHRYGPGRVSRREVPTPRGVLSFEGAGRMDGVLLQVSERHVLREPAGIRTAKYEFTMRPWTARELADRLGGADFENIEVSPGVGRRAADRLLCIATRR